MRREGIHTCDVVLLGAPKGSFSTLLSPQYQAAFGTMPHILASVGQSPVRRPGTLPLYVTRTPGFGFWRGRWYITSMHLRSSCSCSLLLKYRHIVTVSVGVTGYELSDLTFDSLLEQGFFSLPLRPDRPCTLSYTMRAGCFLRGGKSSVTRRWSLKPFSFDVKNARRFASTAQIRFFSEGFDRGESLLSLPCSRAHFPTYMWWDLGLRQQYRQVNLRSMNETHPATFSENLARYDGIGKRPDSRSRSIYIPTKLGSLHSSGMNWTTHVLCPKGFRICTTSSYSNALALYITMYI
jgi:hypothetical protein